MMGLLERAVDRPQHRERSIAEVLRTVAAVTRTGQSLEAGLAAASDRGLPSPAVTRACGRASASIRLGVPPPQAVAELARDSGVPAARLFADVVAVHHRRGGDLGVLCHRLARLLHERARLDREARSLTAQARFTARAVLAMPVIAMLLWTWRSPDSLRSFLGPGLLLLSAPSIVLLVAGVLVIRALAARATDQDSIRARQLTATSRLMRQIAGEGPLARQVARTTCTCATVPAVVVAIAGTTAGGTFLCAVLTVVLAASWPLFNARRQRQEVVDVAEEGIATLLETSIALLAAGASPRETMLGAIDSCAGRLGDALAPAAAQMRLGRSAESAIGALPVVMASAELDAWLHALTTGARLGTPVIDVLETLLRDARSASRERFRARAATIGPRIQLAVVLLIVPALLWIVLVATTTGLVRQLQQAGVVG